MSGVRCEDCHHVRCEDCHHVRQPSRIATHNDHVGCGRRKVQAPCHSDRSAATLPSVSTDGSLAMGMFHSILPTPWWIWPFNREECSFDEPEGSDSELRIRNAVIKEG